MKSLKSFLLLSCLVMTSCLSSNIEKTGIEKIRFGKGGGYTGQVYAHTLTAKGEVLRDGDVINKIDTELTLQLFKQTKKLADYQFHDPGNVYAFIVITTKQGRKRILWSSTSKIDQKVIVLFDKLQALTR